MTLRMELQYAHSLGSWWVRRRVAYDRRQWVRSKWHQLWATSSSHFVHGITRLIDKTRFTRLITPPYTTTSLGSTLKGERTYKRIARKNTTALISPAALLAHYPQPVSQVKKHICTRLNYFHWSGVYFSPASERCSAPSYSLGKGSSFCRRTQTRKCQTVFLSWYIACFLVGTENTWSNSSRVRAIIR